MKTKLTAAILGLGMLGVADVAIAQVSNFKASLDGYQAVQGAPTPPAASLSLPLSTGQATFKVNGNSSIDYTIKYNINTADTAANGAPVGSVTQVHLHFSRPRTNGGVIAFLCTNVGGAPAGTNGTQTCPSPSAPSGTVSGTWTAADIVGPGPQGIAPAPLNGVSPDFAEVIAAIKARATYVCLHTTGFPNGSIRGRVKPAGDNSDDD